MDMGTQGAGRKRLPNRERLSAEDDALNQIAREAEARLAAKRAARAEAREIRMKELERQQKEVEERPDKDFAEKGSRTLPSLSAATLASLGGTSARRGSGDTSVSADTEASMREIKELHELQDQIQDVEGRYMQGLKELKDSLAEVEEKYKKAMVSNAQLDNEKTNYMYQVDTLKDTLLELEEQLAESRRQYEEKNKEFEREKHAHGLLRFQLAEMKAALQQREEMLQALERQKEFFDSVRSERDDLREEVGVLKEELKKHGIVLSSEVATNGETSDALAGAGPRGPARTTTKGEPNALQAPGDGPLGKAPEAEVQREIVDAVGERETLQSAERQEDPVEDGVDTEVLPPGGGAEGQAPPGSGALSLATAAGAAEEDQVQSQVLLANGSLLEHTEQGGPSAVTSTPDAGVGAGASGCWRERDDDALHPEADASGPLNQSGETKETQEQEKQGCGAGLGEGSPEPRQEPAPSQISEAAAVSCSTRGSVRAGPTGSGGPEGTAASRPPRGSVDSVSQDDRCVADVPREVDASAGCGLETELTGQEAAEPPEAPVQSTGLGGCGDEDEAEGAGVRSEKPTHTAAQTSPSSAVATHRAQGAADPCPADAKSKPLDAEEPGEDSKNLQGAGLDSPQKKTRNKKKKNKKKKSPAAAETSKDAEKELPSQSPDLSEVREEELAGPTDERPGAGTAPEAPGSPRRNSVAGSSENPDVPESADLEVDGERNPGDGGDVATEAGEAIADGEPGPPEGDALQGAGAGGSEGGGGGGGGGPDGAHVDSGATPCRPPGDEDVPGSAPPGGQRPSEVVDGESQGAREVSESLGPERDGLAPAGESGDSCPDSREEAGGQSEKDRSKEDCALS
ncbi:leucine-rich repeat flightless-interacting protein 1 isoform X37 [Phyllostomus hastatus]|uniref:leucine-rich repeat flightless-interacting protein 1 isoform X37 n=1 Tax=Phyllostomus hastatus TaxID=9423 RepID=UPI001E68329E|nr:leucine-rich repeat flightless-interacting protein 1 isoform X37 [Phyllostomus hastatus]